MIIKGVDKADLGSASNEMIVLQVKKARSLDIAPNLIYPQLIDVTAAQRLSYIANLLYSYLMANV